ncbi:hypothetical protein JYU34_011297 [Plutella xylostella]|uniref:Uncharacterized protein n=1 Tax=Plutella xylostella TaxID=51655 RepID=A0ABQ7QGM4_PLUXY|nr:hypothetical protein JYU34_011297 [Plutella xylostella]
MLRKKLNPIELCQVLEPGGAAAGLRSKAAVDNPPRASSPAPRASTASPGAA